MKRSSPPYPFDPPRTPHEQIVNLCLWYEHNGEPDAAIALRALIAELAQRDVMLSESIDRQVWLEALTESLQFNLNRRSQALSQVGASYRPFRVGCKCTTCDTIREVMHAEIDKAVA